MLKEKPYVTTRFTSFSVMVLVNAVLSLQTLTPAFAHAPHDTIDNVAISPAYVTDKTVFSVVRGSLVKSVDRGVNWKRLVQGIDSKSGSQAVAIHPKYPNIVYLSTPWDGVYKSEDTGLSWRKINSGLISLGIKKIYVPPAADSGVAFVVDNQGRLYRTMDGGTTWSKIYQHPVPISEITGFSWVAPDKHHMLIGDVNGSLYLSTDGGMGWGKLLENASCGVINAIGRVRNPLISQTFFVGTEKCGIFRTVDGGKSFQPSNTNIEDLNIRSIVMSPNFAYDGKVLASTRTKAIFVSTDAGLTWKKYSQGITTDIQAQLAGLPDFTNVSISPNFENDRTVFLGGFNGLFKSVDGGTNWREMYTMPSTLIQGFAVSPAYPEDPSIAITTYVSGIFKSTDDGVSWGKVPATYGRGYDIAFSPSYAKDKTMFAGIHPNLMAKSTDGGKTWINHTVPVFTGEEGPSIIAMSPTFFDDQTLFLGTRFGSVNKSTDGGTSFTTVYDEPTAPDCRDGCLNSLTVSPNYSIDKTLMLSTRSTGIHISRDGGLTWPVNVSKYAIGQQIKIAVSPNYAVDHTVFFGGVSGLFKTVDDFATWKKISDSVLGDNDYIEELAVSPDFKNDKTVLLSVRGKGLVISHDGGSTFQLTGLVLAKNNNQISIWNGFPTTTQSAIRFSENFATDKTIFASSSERLFKSRDGGNTWKLVVINTKLGQ